MVNRFLGWKLPENFSPDNGISFKKTFNDHMIPPMKHDPVGTNLFDSTQTEAMVRYIIEGMPLANTIRAESVISTDALRNDLCGDLLARNE